MGATNVAGFCRKTINIDDDSIVHDAMALSSACDYIVRDHILTAMGKESSARKRRHEPAPSAPAGLGEFLCFAVYSANHAFNRVYQPLLREPGLTYPQFIALMLLWERDDQTVGDLGEKLFLQSNTLTPMLKRMESLGYIKRSRDSADERQVRVRLTEAGRKLQLRATEIVRRVADATGLQGKQIKQLTEEITALRKALEGQSSR